MATSVDFDYSGPPVNVSNGMAVQLVSQFGVRNAWFAFLKLRGMKMSNEEAEKAQLAFAYFRNKIGHLRRQASELGAGKVKEGEEKAEEGDEVDTLLAEEFDNFLANPDSLELRPDAPTYPDVEERDLTPESDSASTAGVPSTPTTASLLAVIEQSKKRQKLTQKQQQSKNNSSKNEPGNELEKKSDSIKEMITTTGSQQNTKEVAASSGGGTNDGNSSNGGGGGGGGKSTTTTAKNSRDRPDDPETKQVVEKLLAAKEEIARRHAETIDDVVSLVMEKIRNNQPFEGELSVNAGTNTGPPKSHHRRVGAGPAGQRAQRAGGTTAQHQQRRGEELGQESGSNRNFALFQGQPSSSQSGGAQQAIVGQPTATTIMGQQPAQTAFSQLPPGQSIVLLHNSATGGTVQFPSYSVAGPPQPAGKMHAHHQQLNTHGHNLLMPTDQVTILSGGHFPDMIRSSAGGPTTITSAAGAGLITTSGQQQQKQPHHPRHKGTAQQQYQQQQQIIGQVLDTTATGDTAPAAAIPIEVAIQQNMTVQELIQTLKAQSRHQNAHIILHHNANPPTASGAPISASYQQQMFQAQQETPDSSQEAASINEARKLAVEQEQKGTASKKGRKRKAPAADEKQTGGQPAAKQKQQQTQMVAAAAAAAPAAMGGFMKNGTTSLGTAPNKGVETQQQQQPMTATLEKSKPAPKGKKAPAPKQEQQQQPPTISTSVPSTVVKAETAASSSKQQQGIEDLESQLRKANKQLVAERNKANTQKKRAEKLQTELDKALDSIQLLQIDLACQKTDNNNLIAENIALKAENQQLRTKGISAAHRVVTSPTASTSTSVAATGRGRKKKEEAMVVEMQEKETEPKAAKSGRGRKPVVASASAHSMEMEPSSIRLPERTLTPPPLSSELGRRQSKRICVSRNQFMKNLF